MIFLPVTDRIGQPYVGFKLASGQRGLENLAPTGLTLSQAKRWRSALQTRTDSALGTIMTNPEGIPNRAGFSSPWGLSRILTVSTAASGVC